MVEIPTQIVTISVNQIKRKKSMLFREASMILSMGVIIYNDGPMLDSLPGNDETCPNKLAERASRVHGIPNDEWLLKCAKDAIQTAAKDDSWPKRCDGMYQQVREQYHPDV